MLGRRPGHTSINTQANRMWWLNRAGSVVWLNERAQYFSFFFVFCFILFFFSFSFIFFFFFVCWVAFCRQSTHSSKTSLVHIVWFGWLLACWLASWLAGWLTGVVAAFVHFTQSAKPAPKTRAKPNELGPFSKPYNIYAMDFERHSTDRKRRTRYNNTRIHRGAREALRPTFTIQLWHR